MTISYSVTRRELSLGSADTVTGWYAKNFTPSTIDRMFIDNKGSFLSFGNVGVYARYNKTGYCQDPIVEGDEIIRADGSYWKVQTVDDLYNGDAFICYISDLVKMIPHADRPTTYGTDLTIRDVRSRTKSYLDGHLVPPGYIDNANLTADDNATQVDYLVQWANPDYPLTRIFDTKGIELLYSIEMATSEPKIGHDKKAVGYHEKVPIEITAIHKTGITGDKLWWKGEAELRRICETYPLGSVRTLETMKPNWKDLGGLRLYSGLCIMNYDRDKSV